MARTVNGSTTTYYIAGALEIQTGSTLTKNYTVPGLGLGTLAVNVGGTISYLAADGLGSVSEALDGSGNATATTATPSAMTHARPLATAKQTMSVPNATAETANTRSIRCISVPLWCGWRRACEAARTAAQAS